MAETGAAKFGNQQYGVLTKADSVRLIRMAIKGAVADPAEGYATRQLIQRMLPFIGQADAVMLAQECLAACVQQKEWGALAQLLKDKVDKGGE